MVLRITLLVLAIGIVRAVDLPKGDPTAQGIGSPVLVLEPKSGKSSLKHPSNANTSLSFFCGARRVDQPDTDKTYMDVNRVRWSKFPTPDSANVAAAKEVTEFETTQPSPPNNTGWLNFGATPVTAVGKYRCDLWNGEQFVSTGNLVINMRPVFVQEDTQRFDVIEKEKPFELNGGGYTATEGGEVSLSCRALGNPEPTYQWQKADKNIKHDGKKYSIRGHVLNITNIDEKDRAIYKCIATNSFSIKDVKQNYESSVIYNIRIKGKLAWLWPLLAIIVTAVLLAVIIIACEYRRKKREQETRELDPDEED